MEPVRRKNKHNYPRPQKEAEDNADHRAHQRSARYEEIVGRTHSCVDTKKGVQDQMEMLQEWATEVIS
jgi:hypothetical protein